MKAFKTSICLQIAAMLVSAAMAGPAAAGKLVPLQGVLEAVESSSLEFPIVSIQSIGSGIASHLGRFTVVHNFQVDLTTFIAIGSAEFTAANGDKIFTDTVALTDAPIPTDDPNVILISELHTITGGTGRFADASGSFIVNRALNTGTSVTSGSFDGAISH
jgi:hypothetical protein